MVYSVYVTCSCMNLAKTARNLNYYPTALRRVQISRGICTPEDRLDRFPAVDQSVSWISRANSVPLRILLSRIPCKIHEIRSQEHACTNLACWIINLILDVLLCINSSVRAALTRTVPLRYIR